MLAIQNLPANRFHDRSFINCSMLISLNLERVGVTMWPLSEKADSDGTDEPIPINMSFASFDTNGNRFRPIVFHHSIMSSHNSSHSCVNRKYSCNSSQQYLRVVVDVDQLLKKVYSSSVLGLSSAPRTSIHTTSTVLVGCNLSKRRRYQR